MVIFVKNILLQVRIQDLVRGGVQLLRLKIADIAERNYESKVIYL